MMTQTGKAKIFLADERGLVQAGAYRRFSTFNFENYQHEYKRPFGNLSAFNNDTLAGGAVLKTTAASDACIILLPVVGAITYTISGDNERMLYAGQVKAIDIKKGEVLEVANPYEAELVNYLQIWLQREKVTAAFTTLYFDLGQDKNALIKIYSAQTGGPGAPKKPIVVSIGKFAGRNEAVYRLKEVRNSVFAYVLEGAFEVCGRLLHAHDGLALWEINEVEAEALSNNAILLLLEIPS